MMQQRITITVGAVAGIILARAVDIESPIAFLGIVLAGMVVSLVGLRLVRRATGSL